MLLAAALLATGAAAESLVPASDDEIVEILPTPGAIAAEHKRLRRALAERPRDVATALALSRSTLERSRLSGDARLAGQALGVLAAWDGDPQAPAEIRLQRATLLQHLHDFDAAAAELDALLRSQPRQPQALLTLATIRRVQGRYEDSDRACRGLAEAGQLLYARACSAENQALRGEVDAARGEFEALVRLQPGQAAWVAWLRTSLGELEARAGRPDAAVAQLRAALRAEDGPYARLALADVLIDTRRWDEAWRTLDGDDASEGFLLRRAIVARALARTEAAELRSVLARRHAQSALRPQAVPVHARERARFALELDGDAARAVSLARANLQTQREATDLVLMHRAARAAGDAAALAEVAALASRIGLHDARLAASAGGGS